MNHLFWPESISPFVFSLGVKKGGFGVKPRHIILVLLVVVAILAVAFLGVAIRGPTVVTQEEYTTEFESVTVPATETVVSTTTETSVSAINSISQVPQTSGGTYLCYGGICNWYYWFSGYIGQSGQCVGQVPPCISQCLLFTTSSGIYYLDNLPSRYSSGYVTIYGFVEPGPYQGCAGWCPVIYVQSIS